jgi:hypothetical protein
VQRTVREGVNKFLGYKVELKSHLTEGFETLIKAVPVTSLFLPYMEPLSPVSRGKTGGRGSGNGRYRKLSVRLSARCYWRPSMAVTAVLPLSSPTVSDTITGLAMPVSSACSPSISHLN